jgi:hypothetical protein
MLSSIQRHRLFSNKFDEILRAVNQDEEASEIIQLIEEAGELLVSDEPLRLDDVLNELRKDYHVTLHALSRKEKANLLNAAIFAWESEKKITKPSQASSSSELVIKEAVPKEYISVDNQRLKAILTEEFSGQELKNPKSTYAWKYKSGQETIFKAHPDNNALNIFFLGTSTPPLFGLHAVDVCETGHVISQASLQKGMKKEPTLLVKGIATIDMAPHFPLDALENPKINGVSSGGFIESFRKTKTTVKGVGVESRLMLTMDQFFVPNLLKMISNEPLERRGELVLNIAGHSRGGITTFIMADCANQFIQTIANGKEGEDYSVDALAFSTGMGKVAIINAIANIKAHADKIKIHVCALDPVEGARSMTGWDPFGDYIPKCIVKVEGLTKPITCSYVAMPPAVNEMTILLAADERRSGFRPTIPSTDNSTRVNFIREHGKHGTLTGNFGNDAGQGQFHYPSFEKDLALQDGILGLFDQTLLQINKALHRQTDLPPFPLNTFRRIVRQPEYVNTFNLLKQAMTVAKRGKTAEPETQEALIDMMQEVMAQNPQDNVVIYDSLQREAKAAIENHKDKLLSLKKEWQHDTNIGEMLDRDPWHEDRTVYIRGKEIKGTVMWKEKPLATLAPVYLPDALYYGRKTQPMSYQFGYEKMDEVVKAFCQYKNKIDTVAQTYKISKAQASSTLFDKQFIELALMMNDALADPSTQKMAWEMLKELMIDLNYKYHLIPSQEFVDKLQPHCKVELENLPGECEKTQFKAIHDYINTKGCHWLTTEEAEKLIEHIDVLLKQLELPDAMQLVEFQEMLRVMVELDQYVVGLELYSEGKRKHTGQTTAEVDELGRQLRQLRRSLNFMESKEARARLEIILSTYCEKKGFQGIFSRLVKSAPGSVLAIQQVMQHIKQAVVLKEIDHITARDTERVVREDIDHYIKGLEDYFKTYKLYAPAETSRQLLADLKILHDRVGEQDIDKTAYDLRKLLKDYSENNAIYQASGYNILKKKMPYEKNMLTHLQTLAKSRHEERFQEAKAALDIGEPKLAKKKLTA